MVWKGICNKHADTYLTKCEETSDCLRLHPDKQLHIMSVKIQGFVVRLCIHSHKISEKMFVFGNNFRMYNSFF
jgi:hypothetical protein